MPEQAADTAVLKEALQESQIRNIRLRTIEVKLEDEVAELKNSWLTPRARHKATTLQAAQDLVTKIKCDGREDQMRFEEEIKE